VFVLGKALDGDLVLGDPQFPEAHCYIMRGADGVRVKHLGAPPVLSVNGHVTSGAFLSDGDRIRIGPYEFLVRIASTVADGTALGSGDGANQPADLPNSRSADHSSEANAEMSPTSDLKLHAPRP